MLIGQKSIKNESFVNIAQEAMYQKINSDMFRLNTKNTFKRKNPEKETFHGTGEV